ncbi:MAG: HEAT repeat domain-containing protein [Planctomycetota bacterium]
MKRHWWLPVVGLIVAAAWFEPTLSVRGWLRGEPFYDGRSASFWTRQLLSDDNPAVSEEARQKLARDDGSTQDLLCALVARQSAPAELRWTAAEMLGKSGPLKPAVSQALLAALQDPDQAVQSVAAKAVGEVKVDAAAAVPALLKLLSTNASVPVIRALSVYQSEAEPAREPLLKLVRDTKLPSEVRWNAVRTIGKMRAAGAPAVEALIPFMKDAEQTVREHVAEAMGDIGPEARAAVPALIEALDDTFHKVRRDAVRSLGQIGPDALPALPAIEKKLTDPEPIVREAASNAIAALIGKPANPPPGESPPAQPDRPASTDPQTKTPADPAEKP